jgi:ribosome-associated heat shock protein Hsp15
MTSAVTPPLPTPRLDKWLWFARLVKTRSAATRLCAAGCVGIGAQGAVKPHHPVRIGDAIRVELADRRRHLIVRILGTRRGPPAEARLLYDEPVPPVFLRDAAPAWTSLFADDDEEGDVLEDRRLTQSL